MQFVEAHGARIPQIGLGTMTLKGDVCVQAVKTALQMGYRHLDTAAFYGNEVENGEGMRQSGVKREEILLCTKVRQEHLRPADFVKVDRPEPGELQIALRRSAVDPLEQQGHSVQGVDRRAVPGKEGRQDQTCRRRQFHHQDARRSLGGDHRASGLQPDRGASRSSTRTRCWPPARSTAWRWSPMFRSRAARCRAPRCSRRIGKAHGKSAAQVSLRYLVQLGCCAIPRTANAGAYEGKSRRVRFQAVGRRDGRTEEAQRHQYARGQSAARAGVGHAA